MTFNMIIAPLFRVQHSSEVQKEGFYSGNAQLVKMTAALIHMAQYDKALIVIFFIYFILPDTWSRHIED